MIGRFVLLAVWSGLVLRGCHGWLRPSAFDARSPSTVRRGIDRRTELRSSSFDPNTSGNAGSNSNSNSDTSSSNENYYFGTDYYPSAASASSPKPTSSTSHAPSVRSNGESASAQKLPKLIVMGLDGCVWKPAMHELKWSPGGGSPFRSSKDGKHLVTPGGKPVHLIGNVRHIFQELYIDEKWSNTMLAVSSRTDSPLWATELLRKFRINNPKGILADKPTFSLRDALEEKGINGEAVIEMSYDNKIQQFKRLAQRTGIDFKDMLFFDKDVDNCQAVSQLGVTTVHCPHGITWKMFDTGLEAFPAETGDVVRDLWGKII